jgi:hypothetical protein
MVVYHLCENPGFEVFVLRKADAMAEKLVRGHRRCVSSKLHRPARLPSGRVLHWALALVAEARSTGAGDAVELDTIEGMLLDQSAEAVDVAAAARQRDRTPALAQEMTPTTFALGAAYPNPFNPQTTIPFRVPEAGRVHIEVFDVTGRRVARLVDGAYEAGAYDVVFEAGGRPSGLYLVRARFTSAAGRTYAETRHVTLMK